MSSNPSSPLPPPTYSTIPPRFLEHIRAVANCEEEVIKTGLALARERKLTAFEGLVSRQPSDVIRWVAEYHEFGDPEPSQTANRPHSSFGDPSRTMPMVLDSPAHNQPSRDTTPQLRPSSGNHLPGDLSPFLPPRMMHSSPITSVGSQAHPSPGPSPPGPRYFCTGCEEHKGFQDKTAWIAHEQGHYRHEQWFCDKCNRVYNSARGFKAHHKDGHGCEKCKHAKDQIRVDHVKLAFGCGFCKDSIEEFKNWTIHLAEHYTLDGLSNREWNYNKMIMGLLKHHDVEACWTALMEGYGYGSRPDTWPNFSWNKQTSRAIVDCLQLKRYEPDLPGQLEQLLAVVSVPEDYVRPTIGQNVFQGFTPSPYSNDFFQPDLEWG